MPGITAPASGGTTAGAGAAATGSAPSRPAARTVIARTGEPGREGATSANRAASCR